jgi:diacylglycerol kinase family enzyme
MADHIQLVTNPDAGRYSKRTIEALRAAFVAHGASVTISYTGPGRQLIVENDATILCVAGGDGTIRHAGIALMQSGRTIPLAAYPAGTINLFQRETEAPRQVAKFVEETLSGTRTQTHIPAMVNDTVFFGCVSIGPDSQAVASVSSKQKRRMGRYAYGAAVMRQLAGWDRPKLTLVADGKSWPCEAVYIAKGTYFAGPWTFAPQARRSVGKLHVVALKQATRRRWLRFMINLVRGRALYERDNLISLTCSALEVHSDMPWPVQADGDDIGVLPIKVSIARKTLSVR